MARGIELYEQMKHSGDLTGFSTIAWIEMDRALLADIPARSVAKAAKMHPGKHLATTAINEEELGYLREHLDNPYVVKLVCANPVSRNGDNRQPVADELCDTVFYYELASSRDVADEIYLNLNLGTPRGDIF